LAAFFGAAFLAAFFALFGAAFLATFLETFGAAVFLDATLLAATLAITQMEIRNLF